MTFLPSLPLLEMTVVVPLGAMLLAVAAGRLGSVLMLVVAPLMVAVAIGLCVAVDDRGPLLQAVGGWAPPLGIALGADGLSAAFVMASAVIISAVGIHARRAFGGEARDTANGFAFWPLLFGMWAALNAIFIARDLFNLYVALELLTLTAVAMVAYGSTAAAIRYLLFALMGSLAYLMGVALMYASTGALDIGVLAQALPPDGTTLLAGSLMTAGLLAKAALFPLHAWLPPAHGAAPAPASALLSALVAKASFFVIARLWFDVMPNAGSERLVWMLGVLGAAAVLYGSVLAIRQDRLKLVIAYSTVAQIGYLFFIFPLAGGAAHEMPWAAGAWSGGMFHALSHALAKAALFLAAGIVIEALGHDRLDGMTGIARALPMTMAAFGIAALSIMGMPPSGGFMAKYLMLTSALAGGQIFYALVMIAGGLLAAIYLFRPLNAAFSGTDMPRIAAVPRARQAVPLLLALMATGLGIASSVPYAFLQIGRPAAAEEAAE